MSVVLKHVAVLVDRPTTIDGQPICRDRYRFRLGKPGEQLSEKVCHICGYGLTERQMRQITAGKDVNVYVPHRAIPAVYIGGWMVA